MNKIFKTLFPLGTILTTSIPYCSCSNSNNITITLDAGLGFFVEDYKEIDEPSSEPHFIFKKLVVKEGTRLSDLQFKLPVMSPTIGHKDYTLVNHWSKNGQELALNYRFYSNATITAEYFNDFASGKGFLAGDFTQAVIGAAKRCALSGREIPEELFSWPFEVYDNLTSLYTCFGLTKTLAASADAIGETNQGFEFFDALAKAGSNLNDKCGQEMGEKAYPAIVGSIKQMYMQHKEVKEWWFSFIDEITNVAKQCGVQKVTYFAPVVDDISRIEYVHQKEEDPIQNDVNDFIYDSFIAADGTETAFEMYNPTRIFLGELNQKYYNHEDPTELIALYKQQIRHILNK